MSHFKLISSTKASDEIPVAKYISEKTGITVIIANVEGPIVNGFFFVATEAHDDDGLPHTLEHLIFVGSERYPYKGVLDLLANRCMSNGTNAWTDVDHTCYTIYTTGDASMLTLLPVYLDHIMRPTLTDAAFLTEVHHIDGEGQDAGVVYSEMQGRENSSDSRCERRLLSAMYPDSGYSADVGGIMANLRTTTTNEKVREFHRKFYRPENLTIVLTGQIKAEDVFNALTIFEEDIEKKKSEFSEPWEKPWQTVPPPPNYGELEEQWPADTEDCGQILFGWRGPVLKEENALKELTACAVMLRYLCETAAAPLQRNLVEIEDALAGDVSFNLTENMATLIKIELDNVPINKLQAAKAAALKTLKAVRSGDEAIDMERMKRLLKKQLRETVASLESEPHLVVAFRCIGDALHSQSDRDFISRMNPQHDLQELLNEPPSYWSNFLKKYFTDDVVIVVGSPSIALQEKMAEEEKKRIEAQRQKLGKSGLAERAERLKKAQEYNDRPIPAGVLSSVAVPSLEGLKYHAIQTWSTDGDEPCPHFDLKSLPIYARVHSLNTHFVYISLVLDTTKIDRNSRKWLPLLLNGLGECSVRRGSTLVKHEVVISTTEEITVLFSKGIGFGRSDNFHVGTFGNFVHIETRCEPQDYEKVVDLLYEVLYCAEITKERLSVFIQRMINDVSQVRRDGHKMVYDTLRDALYSVDSNVHWGSVLRQSRFLKELYEKLNAGGDSAEAVLMEARTTFREITKEIFLNLAADFGRFKLSVEPWKKFALENNAIVATMPNLYLDAELMSWDNGGFVVGVGGVESSFVAQFNSGPTGYDANTLAPLLVAISYFTQLEGPMWRLIRGSGLSYSYSISPSQSEGRLIFSLYRATNTVEAYTKAKSILDDYFRDGKFDEDLFVSARSTSVFRIVDKEKCPADVVSQSLLNYVQGVQGTYKRDLLRAIESVTPESAHAAAQTWLSTLFDAGKSKIAVVCHPAKVNEMKNEFEKMSVKSFDNLKRLVGNNLPQGYKLEKGNISGRKAFRYVENQHKPRSIHLNGRVAF